MPAALQNRRLLPRLGFFILFVLAPPLDLFRLNLNLGHFILFGLDWTLGLDPFLRGDDKPNDLDHYEGRYGIEDTRHAIADARHQGLQPFCVTIDQRAGDYLPHLFGSDGYIVIRRPSELPRRLPLLYMQLTH